MRVLIVEDNAFNAFCLRRLFESVLSSLSVTVVNNSQAALTELDHNHPDLVVIDGNLGADDGLHCNGPALADLLLQKFPSLPLIAWSDSEPMRIAFAKIFKQHNKPLNEHKIWTKVVSAERIRKTLNYHFSEYLNLKNAVESTRLGYTSGPFCDNFIPT